MCKRYTVVLNVSYGRLRRGRASPVHRDGRRVQLAVHPQGHYLHLRGRRDPRARRTDLSPFFDVRGDEAHSTAHEDYLYFVNRVEKLVQTLGKRMLGSSSTRDRAANGVEAARGFHSTRGYRETPVPVRIEIPRIHVRSSLDRLGRAPDRTVQVPSR